MNFLKRERDIFNQFMPNLAQKLKSIPFLEREKPGNPCIQMLREANVPSLLIPLEMGGMGASPLEAMRVQYILGNIAPSAAIAYAMHQFTVATMLEMSMVGSGLEGLLLEGIANERLLVASGFAEGRPSQGILQPTMVARSTENGIVVNGTKKPCSLSASMDLLTASVRISNGSDDEGQLAVVIIPADSPGIECKKFWQSWILAGAESDELILKDVEVPEALVFRFGESAELDTAQLSGFLWFELLITASYLGIMSGLAERVIVDPKKSSADKVALSIGLEGAVAALEGIAHSMVIEPRNEDLLVRMLFVRYAVQGAIEKASMQAAEMLGGMSFISSPEVSYLLAATRALAFHPPSKASMVQELADYLMDGTIQIR